MQSSIDNQDRPLILRIIYHPLFYTSVLLHGLLLAIPGTPEPEIPPELEEEPQEVQITMLPPIVEPEPEIILEEPEPEPTPPPPQQIQQPEPQPITQPQQQVPAPDPDPQPDLVGQNTEVNPDTEFDPTQYRTAFASNVSNLPGYVPIPLNYNAPLWEDPDQFYVQGDDGEPFLRVGIIDRPVLLNDIRAENVLPDSSGGDRNDSTLTGRIVNLSASYTDGVSITRVGEYAGGPLFEVKSPEGQVIEFINVVPTKNGFNNSPTILVRWANNPNDPTPAGS